MAFDKAAAFEAVQDLLEGLTNPPTVKIGVPRSLAPKVTAFLALAGEEQKKDTTSTIRDDFRVRVHLGYRVGDDAAAAEAAEREIWRLSSAVILAHWANKRLGGTVDTSELDTSPTSSPEFDVRAGQEFRIYVFDFVCTQRDNFPASQV